MSFAFSDLLRWLDPLSPSVQANQIARGPEGGRVMRGLCFDSRKVEPGQVFCAVAGDHAHGASFVGQALENGASGLWFEGLQWPLPESVPCIATVDARQALAMAARAALQERGPRVVAITGSNGKTTTKDFTRAALRGHQIGASPGNLNSSWGLPAAVLGEDPDREILVLEMGASAPGEISALCEIAPPHVGCITNVAPAHLERFASEDQVAKTKAAVVSGLGPAGLAVLPRDDRHYPLLREAVSEGRVTTYGTHEDSDVRVQDLRSVASGIAARIDEVEVELPVFGEVNALNAAAAVAIAKHFGVSSAEALGAIQEADLSPHRSRILDTAGGWIIDDSYNANPASVCAALESLAARHADGRRVAVLGTMAELGTHEEELHLRVVSTALELGIDVVWVVGRPMCLAAEKTGGDRLRAAETVAELLPAFLEEFRVDDAVLVKGSRSVGLERVVDALLESKRLGAERGSENGESA